jgi:uncharacterized protein (DUF1697 family)
MSEMKRFVAFLRGINLGKRRPPMQRLKRLFEELGFGEVETFIASGNVVFSSDSAAAKLEALIAGHLGRSLGYDVDTFVRTASEVRRIGEAKPFPEDGQDGIAVHVGFMQSRLAPETAGRLSAIRTATDEFRAEGREYYWLCRGRISDSKVWGLPEIKALKLPTSTMRNISSIRKLIAKHLA